MHLDKNKLVKTFNEIESALTDYSLPTWDALPEIELYMDQVISIVSKYLEIYGALTEHSRLITPSMINNYVKLGIIPAPIKKKYSKVHLAYLLILCTLKQTHDIQTVQRLIPNGISEKEVEYIYDSFVKNQRKAFSYVTQNVKSVADPIFTLEGDNPDRINDLVMQVSASANIFKVLTEKITEMTE